MAYSVVIGYRHGREVPAGSPDVTPQRRLQMRQTSTSRRDSHHERCLASTIGGRRCVDDSTLLGFITAITDGHFAAYIPLLEVRPDWQHHGIGSELSRAMLARLRNCYMIDLVCDDNVVAFYERLGGTRLNAVSWRHFDQLQRSPSPTPRSGHADTAREMTTEDEPGTGRSRTRTTLLLGVVRAHAGTCDRSGGCVAVTGSDQQRGDTVAARPDAQGRCPRTASHGLSPCEPISSTTHPAAANCERRSGSRHSVSV